MHEKVFEATRLEVLRMLEVEQNLIQDLLDTPDLILVGEKDHLKRNLDRKEINDWGEILAGEAYKVERSEMTLAVVGTMKAGKSTTINAIVGREILPNRNQPMTTLPTLIRHKMGQEIPILKFPKPQPFNQAISMLKVELEKKQQENQMNLIKTYSSDDGCQLIADILSGKLATIDQEYHGADEIFGFLKNINDISRLCQEETIAIPSPLDQYDDIDEFPVIEVEFFHLINGGSSPGRGQFSLLDTPGPNEAGQSHLKEILAEQLEKASAVLAVLDFTQLNSEADEEVRQALSEIMALGRERCFVFVNKYDENDRNGMAEEEVRRYVVSQLFGGAMDPDRIFPVSSKYAYLATRALRELHLNNRLPDVRENQWIEDFGNEALGKRWEKKIDDIVEVKDSAIELWQDSRYAEPLEKVIMAASKKALFIALASALDKMNAYNQQIYNSLNLRSRATFEKIEEVQKHIAALENDIQQIEETQKAVRIDVHEKMVGFQRELTEMFKDINNEINLAIRELFIEEKRKEKEKKILGEDLLDLFSQKETSKKTKRSFHDKSNRYNPDGPNEFESQEEAKEFLAAVTEAIDSQVKYFDQKFGKMSAKKINELEQVIWPNVAQKMAPTLKKAELRMKNSFGITVKFPQPNVKGIKIDMSKINSGDIKEDTRTVSYTRYERRVYTLFLIKHSVESSYNENYFEVNTREIQKKTLDQLKVEQTLLEKRLNSWIKQELDEKITEYFAALADYLEKFRGDLLDTQNYRRLETEQLGKLREAMGNLLARASEHQKDVIPIRDVFRGLQ